MNYSGVEFCRLFSTVSSSCHLVLMDTLHRERTRERGHAAIPALHFFTSWITSSSSITWSLPTFCGLCLTDEPQTRALKKRRKMNSRRERRPQKTTRWCLNQTKTHNYSNCKRNLEGTVTPLMLSNHARHRLTRPFPGGGLLLAALAYRLIDDLGEPIWRWWRCTSSPS